MRKVQLFFAVVLFLGMFSCKKESIPEPNVEPIPGSAEMPLFVSGSFNGSFKVMEIDGIEYSANSYVHQDVINDDIVWRFDLFQGDTIGLPQFSIGINNYCYCPVLSFDDLVFTTDTSHLTFWNVLNPDPFQFSTVTLEYMDEEGKCFTSILSPNTPLVITSTKDTVVDNEEFRILEIAGTVHMDNLNGGALTIDEFNARIALSL